MLTVPAGVKSKDLVIPSQEPRALRVSELSSNCVLPAELLRSCSCLDF